MNDKISSKGIGIDKSVLVCELMLRKTISITSLNRSLNTKLKIKVYYVVLHEYSKLKLEVVDLCLL